MASTHYLSYTNRVASATLTASSQASGWPVANLKEAGHPALPWRSTVTTDSWVVIDLGSATAFDRFVLAWTNINTFKVQQHTSDSWGSPAYDSGTLSTAYDAERRRRRRWVVPGSGGAAAGAFTRRYTRLFIPSQTPADSAAYFEIGYLWAGAFTQLPKSPAPGYRPETVDPTIRHDADLGQWGVEYVTGDSYAKHAWERLAEKTPATPGVGDEYGSWLDVDRSIVAARRKFLHIIEIWGNGAVYYQRQTSPATWPDQGLTHARGPWDLEEVVTEG